jgi:hypothetical protein
MSSGDGRPPAVLRFAHPPQSVQFRLVMGAMPGRDGVSQHGFGRRQGHVGRARGQCRLSSAARVTDAAALTHSTRQLAAATETSGELAATLYERTGRNQLVCEEILRTSAA